jgi:hypothetical protein
MFWALLRFCFAYLNLIFTFKRVALDESTLLALLKSGRKHCPFVVPTLVGVF